ncbi:unnamed protein product [Zymoseptoria tritici ST99CH_3D7]|uniref:Uncharacterized protein n=1 Tax=Zymoseptoria tritici (strain ST99CH_3D7) TaxID=1276538 RepID=A0A1X7RGM7_ZYMT9|nr:unnamed protein product [Zymoseptoria tritici ST99CH_3D7]
MICISSLRQRPFTSYTDFFQTTRIAFSLQPGQSCQQRDRVDNILEKPATAKEQDDFSTSRTTLLLLNCG